MVIRVKFSKYGVLKFIGHLDVLRYFQKAIRRSGIDVAYSSGFNPHQIMSFASALGIGLTSDGEYMDIELNSNESTEKLKEMLSNAVTEGISIKKVVKLKDWQPNERKETAMSQVAGADYFITLKDGCNIFRITESVSDNKIDSKEFKKLFSDFMAMDKINVIKKSKKSEKELDIKPFIYGYAFSEEEFEKIEGNTRTIVKEGLCHKEEHNSDINLYLKLAAGSVINIKPELVIEAFFEKYGLGCSDFGIHYHRMEMYKDISCEGFTQLEIEEKLKDGTLPKRRLVPLYEL